VGKWHLARVDDFSGHPQKLGFDYAAVSRENLGSYFSWSKNVMGKPVGVKKYATTDTVDEAIARIKAAQAMGKPWFIYAAFHAAHNPLHLPPKHLVRTPSAGLSKQPMDLHQYRAMIEAIDTEIGRLLRAAPEAYVFFLSDNGASSKLQPASPAEAPDTAELEKRGKGSIYDGGIHVPFIVAGPDVRTGEAEALVNTTDLFATIAELAGVKSEAEDSISFVQVLRGVSTGQREFAYAERFRRGKVKRTIIGSRYKLNYFRQKQMDARFELYDLGSDPQEQTNLLGAKMAPEVRVAYDLLKTRLDSLVALRTVEKPN
jgi:arylsulfatase A-like enzyme